MIIVFETLFAAAVAFVGSYMLLRKQITNEMRENLKAYERGRVDEAGRRKHEFDLLQKELTLLRDIEVKRQLISTCKPVYDYFIGLVRNQYDYEGEFPGGESATLHALIDGEKKNEYLKMMFQFDKFQRDNFSAYESACENGDEDLAKNIRIYLTVRASEIAVWLNVNLMITPHSDNPA